MKQIPSAPTYFADEDGNIWGKWKRLKPALHTTGYLRVALYVNEHRRNVYVHKAVCEAYFGSRPEGLVSRHLNGNALDNRPSNLSYGTTKQNSDDRLTHGTRPMGESTYNAVLSDDMVLDARLRYATGERQATIAMGFGVTTTTLNRAILGETYSYLPGACERRTYKRTIRCTIGSPCTGPENDSSTQDSQNTKETRETGLENAGNT